MATVTGASWRAIARLCPLLLVPLLPCGVGAQPGVAAWGSNLDGQLGDGTATTRGTPVQVKGIKEVLVIAAGQNIGVALTTQLPAATVTILNQRAYLEGEVVLQATVTRPDNGAPIDGRWIDFSVDGHYAGQALTGRDGSAVLPWQVPLSLGAGDHTITANFAGDHDFGPSTGAGVLTVSKNVALLTWETPPWYQCGQIGETVWLTARLTPENPYLRPLKYPMAYKKLVYTLDGTEVGRNNTGDYGLLTLPVTLTPTLGLGSKTLKATFDGDNLYSAATATASFPIYKTTPAISIDSVSGTAGQTITLKARLVHSWTQAPLPGKKIVFIVAGKWVGTATTDSTGTASLAYAIPAWLGTGAKSVIVRFDSDSSTYSAATVADSLSINH